MNYANETNSITPEYQQAWEANLNTETPEVDWTEPGLRITRLRLLTDPGHPVWDVSYCDGVLPDGSTVSVRLPFDSLPKRNVSKAIVAHAKRDGVYAKRLGILDCISRLW